MGDTQDVHSIPSDSDEEDVDVNLSGFLQIPKVKWVNKGKIRMEVLKLTEFSGPSQEILDLGEHSPLSLLLALISISLMADVVFQINLYSMQ